MNFNLIEGCVEDEDFINEFITLYNDANLKVSDICKHFNISQSKYRRIRKDLINDNKIDSNFRKSNRNINGKYWYYNKKTKCYYVFKNTRDHFFFHSFGRNKEGAVSCVDMMNKYGWTEDNFKKAVNKYDVRL